MPRRRERTRTTATPPTARELLRLVRDHWFIVLLFGLCGLGSTLAFYFNAARSYEAEILIVPKPDAPGGGSPLALLGMQSLGATSHSATNRIDAVLHSRSVTDAIIVGLDLVSRYEVRYIEQARKRLWSSCRTTVEKRQEVVRLRCEDEDPSIVRDMANRFGQLAESGLQRIAIASTQDERAFLEGRIAQAGREMDESAQALRRFREAHAILDLPSQGKALISGMAALEGSVISKRLELSYQRGFASSREASVGQLQQEIAAITSELRALERPPSADPSGDRPGRAGSNVFPPALMIPGLRAELDALLREHEVRQTVFLMLARQHEALQADSAREVSRFIVFDHAMLPTQHIRPTARVLVPGCLAGLLAGVLFVGMQPWRRGLRRRRLPAASVRLPG